MNRSTHSTKSMILGATALAGALALGACATVEEAVVEKTAKTYNANLTGAQEPGGGDADGSGHVEISVSDALDQICYDVGDIKNIAPATMAHIHRGLPGENGAPVLTLKPANEGGFKGCESAPEWLQEAIKANFTGYYVNVHNAEYPNGAIRGQLGN